MSLLVNMALMQWMAYLAWRGGPLLALACSTGSKTLEGAGKCKFKKQKHFDPTAAVSTTNEGMHQADGETYDLMWGKLSSILLPVFLKICSAASATFSSSIFRQPKRDSNVSAEWKDTGCVKDSTCVGRKTKQKGVQC